MKTLISLMIVSPFFWVGCQESSSIVEPESDQFSALNWIELPQNISQSSSTEMEFSVSEIINENSGGKIEVDIQSSILELKEGSIPQLSRFGFIR